MLHGLLESCAEWAIVQVGEGARNRCGVAGAGSFPHGTGLVSGSLAQRARNRGVRGETCVVPGARGVGQTKKQVMHEEEIEGGGSLAGVARGMGGKGRASAVEMIRAPCSDPFRGGVEIARDEKRVSVLLEVSRYRVKKIVVGGFPD